MAISSHICLFTGVEIGLQMANYEVNEVDGNVRVCAILNDGTLERDVMVTLTSTDDSATSTGM